MTKGCKFLSFNIIGQPSNWNPNAPESLHNIYDDINETKVDNKYIKTKRTTITVIKFSTIKSSISVLVIVGFKVVYRFIFNKGPTV